MSQAHTAAARELLETAASRSLPMCPSWSDLSQRDTRLATAHVLLAIHSEMAGLTAAVRELTEAVRVAQEQPRRRWWRWGR
jgi:hypothetical protein